jgi:hypothetical protein
MSNSLQAKIEELKRAHVRELSTETTRKIEAREAERKASIEADKKARLARAEADLEKRVRAKAFAAPSMTEAEYQRIKTTLRDRMITDDIAENQRRVNRGHLSRLRRVF